MKINLIKKNLLSNLETDYCLLKEAKISIQYTLIKNMLIIHT